MWMRILDGNDQGPMPFVFWSKVLRIMQIHDEF